MNGGCLFLFFHFSFCVAWITFWFRQPKTVSVAPVLQQQLIYEAYKRMIIDDTPGPFYIVCILFLRTWWYGLWINSYTIIGVMIQCRSLFGLPLFLFLSYFCVHILFSSILCFVKLNKIRFFCISYKIRINFCLFVLYFLKWKKNTCFEFHLFCILLKVK